MDPVGSGISEIKAEDQMFSQNLHPMFGSLFGPSRSFWKSYRTCKELTRSQDAARTAPPTGNCRTPN